MKLNINHNTINELFEKALNNLWLIGDIDNVEKEIMKHSSPMSRNIIKINNILDIALILIKFENEIKIKSKTNQYVLTILFIHKEPPIMNLEDADNFLNSIGLKLDQCINGKFNYITNPSRFMIQLDFLIGNENEFQNFIKMNLRNNATIH